MKKISYFALLIAELFVGTLLMISLWQSSLYILVAASAAAVIGLSIWQLVRYFKVADPIAKKKALRNIAFAMLIPFAVFLVTYVVIAIAFVIAFA